MIKKIYHIYIDKCRGKASRVELRVKWIAEWVAIFRKKPLYKDVVWTKEQQKEFDDYWEKNYGKKISNRWHKLYQSMNGVFDVAYIPEFLYTTKLEPKINAYNACVTYADKNLTEILYSGVVPDVRAPHTFVCKDTHKCYDSERTPISEEKALKIFSNVGEAVIKPTVGSSSGRSVRLLCMKNARDKRTGESAESIWNRYGKNFIVQERIKPHPAFAKLYAGSINTMRFITYLKENGVGCAPASLRIGSGGSEVDNIHAGGMVLGIDDNGKCREKAYQLGYGDSNVTFTKHPDTQTVFEGYEIPFMEKIREAARKLHSRTPNAGILSWDFTVNDQNEIIVVEVNYTGQSVWFPQIVNEQPIFGEDTEYILQIMRGDRC